MRDDGSTITLTKADLLMLLRQCRVEHTGVIAKLARESVSELDPNASGHTALRAFAVVIEEMALEIAEEASDGIGIAEGSA